MRPTTRRLGQAVDRMLGEHVRMLGKREIPASRMRLPQQRKIRDVAKVVAVSSAKGGVGKSTVAGS